MPTDTAPVTPATSAIPSQRGQAALPVALMALALLISVGLVARWGQAALASSRAQAAADAAALATLAAADLHAIAEGVPPDSSVALSAVRNAGGSLLAFESHVNSSEVLVEVVAEVDGQRASAAAASLLPVSGANGRPGG
ncbi:pilus assembly protein TadG-related protein [Candidatus Poriferisodalis sp.]|uniref:pilus assembly protein TadG-related protein n=1 Tax=Candidatus Poriferisodalis sp. TaxID=3101277 RepID=UPI003B023EAA